MLVHFLQQCKPPVLPIIDTRDPVKVNDDVLVFLSHYRIMTRCFVYFQPSWKSKNGECVAALWLELLRFYTVTFKYGGHVVNVRLPELLTIADKTWGTRNIAIEGAVTTFFFSGESVVSSDCFFLLRSVLVEEERG